MSAAVKSKAPNGTSKASTTNGTAPSTSTEKPDTSAAAGAGGSRPDKKVYDAEQDKIKSEIEAHQTKLVSFEHIVTRED